MAVSKKQQACVNKYVKNNYDRINFTVPKGQKDVIKQAAENAGESVNAYIYEAVRRRMEQERTAQAQTAEDTTPMNTAAEEAEDFDEMLQSAPAVVPEEEVTFEDLFNDK